MAHHDITINLTNGHAVPVLPPGGTLRVCDTVKYSSPDGKVRVVFETNGSPFRDQLPDIVHDEVRTVQKAGVFSCKCFITPSAPADAPEVGWFAGEGAESGGDHDVKP